MSIQEQRPSTASTTEDVDELKPTLQSDDKARAEQLKAEADAMLDEIDAILDEEACANFIQKGGE